MVFFRVESNEHDIKLQKILRCIAVIFQSEKKKCFNSKKWFWAHIQNRYNQSLVYSMGLVCLHTDMPTLNAHWTKLLAIVKFLRGYSLVP